MLMDNVNADGGHLSTGLVVGFVQVIRIQNGPEYGDDHVKINSHLWATVLLRAESEA